MADKKISQFDTFPGAADDEVFFVVASGDADNPNASNYRYPFTNLTTDITNAGSAWATGTDLIYTLTGAVGLGTTDPIHQLDVATTGRFRSDLIVSGDLYVSGTTHINKIIDASITGTISGVTGEFADGIFADSLTISGNSVITGGSIEVPGGGGSVIGGDVSNINFGGTEASDTRAVNFQVGGVDKLVIGSDGDVGIAEDLTVSGSAYVSGDLDVDGNVRANDFGFRGDDIGYYYFDDFGGSNFIGRGIANPYISLYHNAKQTMVWKDGKVGIGTADLLTALHLKSDDNNTSVTSNNIRAITLQDTSSVNGALSQINFATSDNYGVTQIGSRSTTNVPGLPVKGEIYFVTRDIDHGFTQKMVIKPDGGNVGIGYDNPQAKLHVTGGKILAPSGDFTESLTISGNSVLTGAAGSVGGKWSDSASVGDIYYNGGDVGIGTTSPGSKLEVVGDIQCLGGNVLVSNGGAAYGIGMYSPAPNELGLSTNSVERIRIDDVGNVGIGTASPLGPLHVSNVSENTINLTREINVIGIAGGASSKIQGGALSGPSPSMGAALGFSLVDTDGAGVIGKTHGYLYFETKDSGLGLTEKMRITDDGKVGIGTNNPQTKLHVSGLASCTGLIVARPELIATYASLANPSTVTIDRRDQNPTDSALTVSRHDTSYGTRADAPIFNILNGHASSTEIFRIQGDGAVSGETLNFSTGAFSHALTTSLLTVNGGALNVDYSSNNLPAARFHNGGGDAPSTVHIVETESSSDHYGLFVGSNDANGDILTSTLLTKQRNVGIGVTNPAGKLHIADLSEPIGNVDVTLDSTGLTNGTSLNTKLVNGDKIRISTKTFTVSSITATTLTLSSPWPLATQAGVSAFKNKELLLVSDNGKVGIGTTTPSAPLEVNSVSGGVIMPRMTTAQMNAITAPSNGEMIYNTSSGKFAGYAGGSWTALH